MSFASILRGVCVTFAAGLLLGSGARSQEGPNELSPLMVAPRVVASSDAAGDPLQQTSISLHLLEADLATVEVNFYDRESCSRCLFFESISATSPLTLAFRQTLSGSVFQVYGDDIFHPCTASAGFATVRLVGSVGTLHGSATVFDHADGRASSTPLISVPFAGSDDGDESVDFDGSEFVLLPESLHWSYLSQTDESGPLGGGADDFFTTLLTPSFDLGGPPRTSCVFTVYNADGTVANAGQVEFGCWENIDGGLFGRGSIELACDVDGVAGGVLGTITQVDPANPAGTPFTPPDSAARLLFRSEQAGGPHSLGPEACNNLDDNGDGTVDEGCDDDGDGFCEPRSGEFFEIDVCPAGTGDCNDDDPSISPAAAETCDGIDNNCNGEIDESFEDSDGDGVGDVCDVCPDDPSIGLGQDPGSCFGIGECQAAGLLDGERRDALGFPLGFFGMQLRRLGGNQYEIHVSDRTNDPSAFGRITVQSCTDEDESSDDLVVDRRIPDEGTPLSGSFDTPATLSIPLTIDLDRFSVTLESQEFSGSAVFFGDEAVSVSNPPTSQLLRVTRCYSAIVDDRDGDGIFDCEDNCLDDANELQLDTDGDSVGDLCDNCPLDGNPSQGDFDGDTIGDACEAFEVMSLVPADGTLDVSTSTQVTIQLAVPADPTTVTDDSLRVTTDGGIEIEGERGLNGNRSVIVFNPTTPLPADTLFIVELGSTISNADGTRTLPSRTSRFRSAADEPISQPLPQEAQAQGLVADARSGSAVAGAGDIDGDGVDDLLVGAPGTIVNGSEQAGSALLYLGNADPSLRNEPDLIIEGSSEFERLGTAVAGDFDFNGDGRPDLLIGAEQVNRPTLDDTDSDTAVGPGRAYLVFLDPTLLPGLGQPGMTYRFSVDEIGINDAIPGLVIEGVDLGDQLGFAVAGGCRANADELDDIVIGSPGRDVFDQGGTFHEDAGGALIVFGSTTLAGVVTADRIGSTAPDGVDGVDVRGDRDGDRLGFAVACPGDVTATPGDDIALGAPFADPEPGPTEPGGARRATLEDAGSVFVINGGNMSGGIIDVCSIGDDGDGTRLNGDQLGEQLGSSIVGGGDNLADGAADLVIGAPGFDVVPIGGERGLDRDNAGRVVQTSQQLVGGIIDVCAVGDLDLGDQFQVRGTIWQGESEGDRLGEAVAGVGDVTGNGLDDIVLGAPFADPEIEDDGRAATRAPVIDAGIVYLIEGTVIAPNFGGGIIDVCFVGGDGGISGIQSTGVDPGEHAGIALADLGDVDGDKDADYAVGAPGKDDAARAASGPASRRADTNEGTVYIVTESEPAPVGECSAASGCTVADLATGAQIEIAAGALDATVDVDVTGIVTPAARLAAGPAELPPAPAGLVRSGAAVFTPESLEPIGGTTISIPAVREFEAAFAIGDDAAVFRADNGGWSGPLAGGVVAPNPQFAARPAVRVDVARLGTYAVMLPDSDGDGIPDALDDDRDGDGITDDLDVCPEIPDPLQSDLDGDGRGDLCDDGLVSVSDDQYVAGLGAIRHERIYGIGADAASIQPGVSFLPAFVGLDAFDVDVDGRVLFSVARRGGVYHEGGFVVLEPDRVHRYDPLSGVIDTYVDWSQFGSEIGSLVALARVDASTIVFAVDATRGVTHAGGYITLRVGNVYRFDLGDGTIELVLDGVALGLPPIDALESLDDGRLVISPGADRFYRGRWLFERDGYSIAVDGSVTKLVDGAALGLGTLDALSLPAAGDATRSRASARAAQGERRAGFGSPKAVRKP